MSNEDTTPEAQPEEASTNVEESTEVVDDSADAEGAVEVPADANEEAPADAPKAPEAPKAEEGSSDLLARLNKELGKNFPDIDTALKSIKDTTSYVGKRQDTAVEEAKNKLVESGEYLSKSEFEEYTFFKDNPNLEPHKEVLGAIAKDKGLSLPEAAKLDSVKTLIEKAGKYDETENVKSVLETNPRLKSSSDRFTQARESLKTGKAGDAASLATKAVLEAYSKEN